MQAKHPCFRKDRSEWKAVCLVSKPGTFISVSYKGSVDLKSHLSSDKHCKAERLSLSTEVTNYFVTTE